MNNIFLTFNNHANVEDEFYISQQKTDIVERDKSDAHNYMARDYGSKKKQNLQLVLRYQPRCCYSNYKWKVFGATTHSKFILIWMCLSTQVPLGGLYLKYGCNMRNITNMFDSPQTVDFPQHQLDRQGVRWTTFGSKQNTRKLARCPENQKWFKNTSSNLFNRKNSYSSIWQR